MVKAKVEDFLLKTAIAAGQAANLVFPRSSDYARDFSDAEAEAAKIQQPKDYLRPVEAVDKDEAKVFHKLSCYFDSDAPERHGSEAGNAVYHDPHWGHTTGFFAGTLDIKAAALKKPYKDFRIGLFEKDRTYKVVVRPNFLFDDQPEIAISRLAIKIEFPEPVPNEYQNEAHELDLLLSEGLPLDHAESDGQGFFFRDAKQMLMLRDLAERNRFGKLAMAAHGGNGAILKTWKSDIFEPNTDRLYKEEQRQRGWAGKHYFSAGPYALDDGAMKFCLEPQQEHTLTDTVELGDSAHGDILRERNWPEGGDEQVSFTLKVQIATADAIRAPNGSGHPSAPIMAAEYTDIAWDQSKSRFEEVGTLTISRTPPDHWSDLLHFADLPMNAWNTFHCTRPLGQLFRARRVVHRNYRKARLEDSFQHETGGETWTCPFSGLKRP